MDDFERKREANIKRNEKFLKEFEEWLTKKDFVNKTIKKHLSNIELYINEYLNYYEVETPEEGIDSVYMFLSDWFIRKCLWASRNSLKETAASIKKFYQYMTEYKYVKEEDYKEMASEIKDSMDELLEMVDDDNFYSFF